MQNVSRKGGYTHLGATLLLSRLDHQMFLHRNIFWYFHLGPPSDENCSILRDLSLPLCLEVPIRPPIWTQFLPGNLLGALAVRKLQQANVGLL